jgi:hypothetical protein
VSISTSYENLFSVSIYGMNKLIDKHSKILLVHNVTDRWKYMPGKFEHIQKISLDDIIYKYSAHKNMGIAMTPCWDIPIVLRA